MRLKSFLMCCIQVAGPALGIGRECDGLGPMPLGALKFILYSRVYIEILGFWGFI